MQSLILSLFLFVFPMFFPICACHVRNESNASPQTPPIQDVDFEFLDDAYFVDVPPEEAVLAPEIWDVFDVNISQVDITKKLVALTFDDTPARNLENLLAVFAAYNEANPSCKATASLFVNGYLANPESTPLLTAAYAMHFELGNHTYSHLDLTTLTEEVMRVEIDRTDEILEKIDGKPRHLLRAPFGKSSQTLQSQANAPIINWSIDTLDWTGVSAEEICNTVLSQLFSGAIVLMHDSVENTVDALKTLLPALKAQGYQAVTVSQLAKIHGCALHCGKEYIRARKQ